MDSEELVLLLILAVVSGTWTFRAGRRLFHTNAFSESASAKRVYGGVLAICIAVLWLCLATIADREVRQDIGLQALFVVGGIASIAIATEVTALFGLDALADGVERDNAGARVATCGLWAAVTICAIAANIGEGDFVGTTFAPLSLALGFVLAGIGIYAAATRSLAPIVVERNAAAGVRFAGLAVGLSIPLAKAASGDWVSMLATWHDFAVEIPILVAVLIVALLFERHAATAARPPTCWWHGLVPAVVMIGMAAMAAFARDR